MFRGPILTACVQSGRDVLLVHTGLFPETMDPVSVDAVLAGPHGPVIVNELAFMRGYDGSLWLVPLQVGPFIEIRAGLMLETMPPFVTWDERSEGVCRAAAEIVRIVSRRRTR